MQGADLESITKRLCGKFEEKVGTGTLYGERWTSESSKVKDPSIKDAKEQCFLWGRGRRSGRWRRKKSCKYQIETGRHHQIRVQMAAAGCPIWGDAKYNEKQSNGRRKIALCKSFEFCIRNEGKDDIWNRTGRRRLSKNIFWKISIFGVDKQQDFS